MTEQYVDLVLEITRTIETIEMVGGIKPATRKLFDGVDSRNPAAEKLKWFLLQIIAEYDADRDKVAMANDIASFVMSTWEGPEEAAVSMFTKLNKIIGGTNG